VTRIIPDGLTNRPDLRPVRSSRGHVVTHSLQRIMILIMLRRSAMLSRIGSGAPCLLCHLTAQNLSSDAAFLIPSLALAVWDSTELGHDRKIAVNDALVSFLPCCDGITRAMSPSLAGEILRLVGPDAGLTELCEEFIGLSSVPSATADPTAGGGTVG